MKNIAVVILNYNGVDLLRKFLPSIINYSKQATIYVIDNASTDQSIEMLKAEFPQIIRIINQENYGFAKGYNQGLKQVTEPILALVNSDIEVTKDWLDPIVAHFDSHPTTAIIQPKILDYKNKSYFEYAGAGGGFIDKYGFAFCRGRIFDTLEQDLGQYNDTRTIFWASGACFFIRNNVFNKLKGFDDDFFAHQEEIDLCWRAHHEQYIITYCGSSTVYHVGGATLNYVNPQKTYLNFRNSLLMLYKNLPKKGKFSIIFQRLCLDGIAALRFLCQGKPKHFYAVIRSHIGFYSKIKQFKHKVAPTPIPNYYQINNIAIKHFLCNKKHFNTL